MAIMLRCFAFVLLASTSAQLVWSPEGVFFVTGTSIAGDYGGSLRPQIHFSPPQGFMNDPNGLFIDEDGTYHLYYQLNPEKTTAGDQHWGHATSRDLYIWEHHAIALSPDNRTAQIFSGSAVVDVNNTSGLFPNQRNGVVALYTLNTPYQQSQALAYSHDGGYTFTKYAGNPVLTAGSLHFRDPKVIWHQATSKWVMVISYAQELTIGVFISHNLLNWTHASNFTGYGSQSVQWECPNLVEMPIESTNETMYVMFISINPGAPLGGSTSQYYPGTFNGTHFTPVDMVARSADFGKDNYAGQFFFGIPGDQPQISIHWASNWQYTNYLPTGPSEGWQCSMAAPRVVHLKRAIRTGYQLVSRPCDLSPVLPRTPLARNGSFGNGALISTFGGHARSGSILLEMNITGLNMSNLAHTASANFTFYSSVSGESLSSGQFFGSNMNFFMNRGLMRGFENPFFTDKVSTEDLGSSSWEIQMIVDRSIWEVFLLGGEKSATLTFFPESPLDTIVAQIAGLNDEAVVSVSIWELESAWTIGKSKGGETVRTNKTMAIEKALKK